MFLFRRNILKVVTKLFIFVGLHKTVPKHMGTLGFEDSDAKSLLLLKRLLRVGTDDRDNSWALNLISDTHHTRHQRIGMQCKDQIRDSPRQNARQGSDAW